MLWDVCSIACRMFVFVTSDADGAESRSLIPAMMLRYQRRSRRKRRNLLPCRPSPPLRKHLHRHQILRPPRRRPVRIYRTCRRPKAHTSSNWTRWRPARHSSSRRHTASTPGCGSAGPPGRRPTCRRSAHRRRVDWKTAQQDSNNHPSAVRIYVVFDAVTSHICFAKFSESLPPFRYRNDLTVKVTRLA